jgi:hypothetical protein
MTIPRRKNFYFTTAAENAEYANAHGDYVGTTSAVPDHVAWHGAHGSGHDDHFLFWHRYYLRGLEDYLGAQGIHHYVPIAGWPSNVQIPAELDAGTADTSPNVNPPTWTTLAGGAAADPVFGYTKLGQFKTSNELGQSIGHSWHGQVHGAIGGTMATFESPEAPIFFPWHGYIDHIWANWQRHCMTLPTAIVRGSFDGPSGAGIRINLFVRRLDGKLWERYWNGSAWSWNDTGKQVLGRAVALTRGNAKSPSGGDIRINLFVAGGDRKLWERYWNGSAWSWNDTGKEIDGEPLLIARGNVRSTDASTLRINLFARGVGGTLWERYWNGASWSWTDTGKKVAGDPIAVVRGDAEGVEANDLRINVFVRGTDGTLWERYWNGTAWSWADTGKKVADDPVAIIRGNSGSPDAGGVRINLWVKGLDGKLWERYWNGASWSWNDTGKGIVGRVVPLVRGNVDSPSGADIRINLFLQGTDGKLWERYWNGAAWSWNDTGKAVHGEPTLIVRGNVGDVDGAGIRINLFVPVLEVGTSGGSSPHPHYNLKLWERYWNGSSWSWSDTAKNVRSVPMAIARGDVEGVESDDLRINLWVAGDDGKLWERYWNGAGWSWADTNGPVPV